MRQNLALVVGLQGRFAEAEKIARADLSPEEAAANVAYLRQMLASRRTQGRQPKPRKARQVDRFQGSTRRLSLHPEIAQTARIAAATASP